MPTLPSVTGPAKYIADYDVLLGQFGVGIFFIISGFVIPFSIASGGMLGFLKRRAFRIFPTYAAGFSLVVFSIWVITRYRGTDFGYSVPHILSHYGILTRGILGYSRIDGISWTLEIELVFYLIVALLGTRLAFSGPRTLITAALIVSGASVASIFSLRAGFYNTVGNTGVQFWASLLLIIGVSYHLLFIGCLTRLEFSVVNSAITALVIAVWLCSDRTVYNWQLVGGYILAILIFSIGFRTRARIYSNIILSHLADISYPLYVVHALTGYAVMYWAIDNDASSYEAVGLALLISYLLSVLIHISVEQPFMEKSGKSRKIKGQQPSKIRQTPYLREQEEIVGAGRPADPGKLQDGQRL
ncbi:acyltransferase family protein [Ollibium composti]|uniref:acyltransferase family protein n=1 Tax=Ollibium composti TaxID=2675109 RepID=UPI002EDAFF20